MAPEAGLDGGLLVGGDHEISLAEWLSLPLAGVEVEHPGRLGLEVRVAGKIHERCRHGLMASS